MSLNFNGPSYVPMIQESQSMKNNGGGGNTGYFQRGKKKENKEETNLFQGDDEQDEFIQTEAPTPPEATEKKDGILSKIVKQTKDFIKTATPSPTNPFVQMEE